MLNVKKKVPQCGGNMSGVQIVNNLPQSTVLSYKI